MKTYVNIFRNIVVFSSASILALVYYTATALNFTFYVILSYLFSTFPFIMGTGNPVNSGNIVCVFETN